MKKVYIGIILVCIAFNAIAQDELSDLLQDLAIQTACLGMYSSTEASGDYINRFNDPPDWYTPPMMASRFARMSGNMTRTATFYGICFDYAQFAYEDITRYQTLYNNAGMKDSQFYIAVTFSGDPNTIYLYDPVSPDRATRYWNGIPVREYTRHQVRAHDNATGHAWLWVQHKNGTWYWIDPTWTDNTGYPWWGIVQDGREVQYYPNPNYSIASNFPRPPSPNETQSERETRSPNSTYVNYTGYYDPSLSNYLLVGYNYINGAPFGITIADSMFFEKSLMYISANFGFSTDQNKKRRDIEWIYGVAFSLTDWLRIPIGIGANHVNHDIDQSDNWNNRFVMEGGLQLIIFNIVALTATYRLKGFSESSYAVGVGIIF